MTPWFVDASDRLPTPCAEERPGCPSSQAWLADLDGDGDLDALVAHGGDPVEGAAPTVWTNEGGGFVDPGALPGEVVIARQVAVGDLDDDGWVDLVAPGPAGDTPDAVWMGGADGFTRDDGRLGTTSRAAAAILADVDGDLDLDLFMADRDPGDGLGVVALNDGGTLTPTKAGPAEPVTGGGVVDAEWLDADGDWDPDLLVLLSSGQAALYRNDGFGVLTEDEGALPAGIVGIGATACDVDGDADLDVWIGLATGGVALLENGGGTFAAAEMGVEWSPPVADVACADLDDDGDADLLAATLGEGMRALRQDDGAWVDWPEAVPTTTGEAWGLAVGDVDGDARLDVLVAQGAEPDGTTGTDERERLWLGTEAQPADASPPGFRASRVDPDVANGSFVTVRLAVTDRAGTALGPPRVAVWAEAGGTFAATWTGGDQFVASVPLPLDGEVDLTVFAEDPSGNLATLPLGTLGIGPPDTGAGPGATPGGCGCATGGGGGAWGLALLGAAVVGRRRAPALRGAPRATRG